MFWIYVTQHNKRYIFSTFEKIKMFALSNRRFNKLSNDTKLIKIEVTLLKIQVLQSTTFLLFSLYLTHCFVHYLRINLANKIRCTFCCIGSHIHLGYTLFALIICFCVEHDTCMGKMNWAKEIAIVQMFESWQNKVNHKTIGRSSFSWWKIPQNVSLFYFIF